MSRTYAGIKVVLAETIQQILWNIWMHAGQTKAYTACELIQPAGKG